MKFQKDLDIVSFFWKLVVSPKICQFYAQWHHVCVQTLQPSKVFVPNAERPVDGALPLAEP